MNPDARPPVQRVSLDDLRSTAIVPVISPLPTAMALVGTALSDHGRQGAWAALTRAFASHLRRRDIAALLPLRTSLRPNGSGGRPNEIMPLLLRGTIDEQLDAVSTVTSDQLAKGFAAAAEAGHPVGPWWPVARAPAPWLRAYVDAMHRAWRVIGPMWSRHAHLLDREVERISVALANGAGAELISQLFPQGAIEDGRLLLPSHSDRSGRLRLGDTLFLHPLLGPPDGSGWTDDYGEVCLAVRYPVPGAHRAVSGDAPPPASLSALLGSPRATILHSLDRPVTAGRLAALLHGSPSMVTHHLAALEKGGLVTRERRGRHIHVRRTARGTELIAVYDPGRR